MSEYNETINEQIKESDFRTRLEFYKKTSPFSKIKQVILLLIRFFYFIYAFVSQQFFFICLISLLT